MHESKRVSGFLSRVPTGLMNKVTVICKWLVVLVLFLCCWWLTKNWSVYFFFHSRKLWQTSNCQWNKEWLIRFENEQISKLLILSNTFCLKCVLFCAFFVKFVFRSELGFFCTSKCSNFEYLWLNLKWNFMKSYNFLKIFLWFSWFRTCFVPL